ncbi:MAG: hydrogenase [Microcoleaceae cyanobacterium]
MELTHQNLLKKLASLSESFPNLGIRLSLAAKELQNVGTPPSESLIQELMAYSKSFADLKNEAIKLAKLSQIYIGVIVSFPDLENLIKAVTSNTSKIESPTHQQALSILDRVLAIAHQEQTDFPPLQIVKAQATELYQLISNSNSTKLPPGAEGLIEGTHPLSALLKLVQQRQNLDDEQWLTLEEKVTNAFGKKLIVAISRGKLTISKTSLPENPPQKASGIKLPALEELDKSQKSVTQPVDTPKSNTETLPPLIVVPSGGGEPNQINIDDPDVMILEDPTPSQPLDEIIIVPGVEPSKNSSTMNKPNIIFRDTTTSRSLVNQKPGISVGLKVLVHIQNIGDRVFGAQEYAGTRGQGFRVEGFEINIEPPVAGLNLEYMAHISGIGDTPWLEAGTLAGERGKARRLEGFAIRLTGPQANNYDVFYTAHVQNRGDLPVYPNGEYCGTRNQSLRVEGMKVWIQPKTK